MLTANGGARMSQAFSYATPSPRICPRVTGNRWWQFTFGYSKGRVPADGDVMLTSWRSIQQDRAGIKAFYSRAFALLPQGVWMPTIDQVGSRVMIGRGGDARNAALADGLAVHTECPPVHHPGWTV